MCKYLLKKFLHREPILLLMPFLILLSACDSLTFKSETFGALGFNGISAIEREPSGSYVLFWSDADGRADNVSYKVYMLELDQAKFQLQSPDTDALPLTGGRQGKITAFAQGESPSEIGRLVKTLNSGERSYKVDLSLSADRAYAFQVQAVDADGRPDSNIRGAFLSAHRSATYIGCLSAEPQAFGEVRIDIEYPDQAERVTVSRNGSLIHATTSPTATRFVDSDLLPGQTYIYTCEAKVGTEFWTGNTTQTVQIDDPRVQLKNFLGCIEAVPLGPSEIEIRFEFPENVEQMIIRRDAAVDVFKADANRRRTSFVDRRLEEAQTYEYQCIAVVMGLEKVGERVLEARTLSSNPPSFQGITAVEAHSSREALVRWGVARSDGVAAKQFKVYASPGNTLDWGAAPAAIVSSGNLSAVIGNLGDELPYVFGVRACSVEDLCDRNEATLSLTLPDRGAPTSPGVTKVIIDNGDAVLTVPWEGKHGAVSKRLVYQRTGTFGGADINNYTLVRTIQVLNHQPTQTEITINGLAENTTYHFIVRDEDPSGNISNNTNVASLTTGDLTPPTFIGISNLTRPAGMAAETGLVAHFVGIDRESDQPHTGASHYLVYVKSGGGDACKEGVLKSSISSASYTPSQTWTIQINGLIAKTTYGICLKARDSAGNISTTTTSMNLNTLDLTPPLFDGVQAAQYSQDMQAIVLSWNASPSSDIAEYRAKVWKSPNPVPGSYTFFKGHPGFATGFSFTSAEFAFSDLETINVLVDACDTSGNCTAKPTITALNLVVPDVTPPEGFLGIRDPSAIGTPSEGTLDVAWFEPSNWTGYRGFIVYNINPDNSLSILKTCPCSNIDCPNQITSCSITGLDAARSYKLHVRAYDQGNNVTTYLDPASYFAVKKTTDVTPPSFGGSVTAAYSAGAGGISLAWTPATDNQYSSEPGAGIAYYVYRKKDAPFTDPTQPQNDPDSFLPISTPEATGVDKQSLQSNGTYYYVVCAEDSSGNRTCNSTNMKSIITPDIVAPTVSLLATDKKSNKDTWNLTWSITDNSPNEELLVTVRRYISDSETPPDTESSYADIVGSGMGITSLSGLTGPANANKWIHYLVTARDQALNTGKAKISVYSTNVLSVTEITRAVGHIGGGKMIVIKGSGFSVGTSISLSGAACSPVHVFDSEEMACQTGPSSAGAKIMTVTTPSGSTLNVPNAYTYCDPSGGGCSSICDNPQSWGASFAGGSGTAGFPYLVCNTAHFEAYRTLSSSLTYLQMEDHIDFHGVPFTPLTHNAGINCRIFLNGKDFVIANITYSNPMEDGVGFCKAITSTTSGMGFSNVHLRNFELTGRDYVGSLVGEGTSSFTASSISGKNIKINGRAFVGGLFGHSRGPVDHILLRGVEVFGQSELGGLMGKVGTGTTIDYVDADVKVDGSGANVGGIMGSNPTSTTAIKHINAKVDIIGASATGGAVGISLGIFLTDVNISGTVFGSEGSIGGVVGAVGGSGSNMVVINLRSQVDVIGGMNVTAASGLFGGLRGSSILKNVYANGDVTAEAGSVSGIFVSSSTNDSSVVGGGYVGSLTGGSSAGGLTTVSTSGTHSKLRTHGDAYVSGGDVAGLAPRFRGTITKSFSTMNVTAGGERASGLVNAVASTASTISDSYALGTVSASNRAAALMYTSAETYIDRTFATGRVNLVALPAGQIKGGILAVTQYGRTPILNDVFWDINSTAALTSAGGGQGKTTQELYDQSTYTNFNFGPTDPVWLMPENPGYPILAWQKQAWAAQDDETVCTGSGGAKIMRIYIMNHDLDRTMRFTSNAIDNASGGTISQDTCSGATLSARGGSCSFLLSYVSTPTVSDTDITLRVSSGSWFHNTHIKPEDVDNSCP